MNSSTSPPLINIIKESLNLAPNTIITLASDLTDELSATPVDIILIAMAVEEEFKINLPSTTSEVKTYGDLLTLVEKELLHKKRI